MEGLWFMVLGVSTFLKLGFSWRGAFLCGHLYLLWIPGHIDLIERVLIE